MNPPQILQINFRRKARGNLQAVTPGVYKYKNAEGFYCRPVVDGQQRLYALKSLKGKAASIEWGKLQGELAQYHAGLAKNPFIRSESKTLKALCKLYLEEGCPGKNSKPKFGTALKEETSRVNTLMQWSGAGGPADEMTPEKWTGYHAWRVKRMKRWSKGGDRAVDKEKNTLSNIFHCAIRHQSKTGIKTNPISHGIQRFRDPALVAHCRDKMPRSGDELHLLAGTMGQVRISEVFMWQMLLQACIGTRSAHTLKLRWDAKHKEPGHIQGGKLYLYRSISSKGTYGHIEIHPALDFLLHAMKNWHQRRYPAGVDKVPWYLPSPEDPSKPVSPGGLTHRLADITHLLKLPQRTSQGMRSFYVNVRRSEGWADEKIALRVGHTTRGKLIVEVYGEGLDYKLDWFPETVSPAWAQWLPGADLPRPVQLDLL